MFFLIPECHLKYSVHKSGKASRVLRCMHLRWDAGTRIIQTYSTHIRDAMLAKWAGSEVPEAWWKLGGCPAIRWAIESCCSTPNPVGGWDGMEGQAGRQGKAGGQGS